MAGRRKKFLKLRSDGPQLARMQTLLFIYIFSSKLLVYSQTFINLKRIKKLETLYEFDIRFHTKVLKSN